MNIVEDKRLLGQYFTITNPFDTVAFYKWIEEMEGLTNETIILEPFAGANNIPKMIIDAGILTNNWKCFDISPSEENKCENFVIEERDTIQDFPKGFDIAITNPPYLSKNSATRRNLEYPKTDYDDMYKLCLDKMLENCKYVAAIIPETFIASGQFTDRLKYVVSLTCKMFDDTECPVCLAMFNKDKTEDFTIYQMNDSLGNYSDLCKGKIDTHYQAAWKINDPLGEIGIVCIDNTKKESIYFCKGDNIDSSKIKVSSRSLTRVSGLPKDIDLDLFINKCNEILVKYRLETKDAFMASFKGLRADNKYRRRLDFATAKQIMSKALEAIHNEEN